MRGRPDRGEASDMREKTTPEAPPPKDEAAPFGRFEEFTQRLVQVPKSEIGKEKKRQRRRKRPK